TAIIFDLDDHLIALVISIQANSSTFGLTQTGALCRIFNAVTNGIAHQMRRRLGHGVHQAFIKIGILHDDDQIDLFAALPLDFSADVALFFRTSSLISSTLGRAITIGIRHFAVTFSSDRALASNSSRRAAFADESVAGRAATT